MNNECQNFILDCFACWLNQDTKQRGLFFDDIDETLDVLIAASSSDTVNNRLKSIFDGIEQKSNDSSQDNALLLLYEKVFFNKSPIILKEMTETDEKNRLQKDEFSNVRPFAYHSYPRMQPAVIFQFAKQQIDSDSMEHHPEMIVLMYLLLKEMSFDELCGCFPDRKERVETAIDRYKRKMYYCGQTQPSSYPEESFKKDASLLRMLFYPALWEVSSYFTYSAMEREKSINCRGFDLSVAFDDAYRNGTWYKEETIEELFHRLCNAISLQTQSIPTGLFHFEDLKSHSDIVFLLYHLSRREAEGEKSELDLMTYLSDIQKRSKCLTTGYKYCQFPQNQENLKKFDVGFKVEHAFSTIYPFSADYREGVLWKDMYTLDRSFTYKLFFQTDVILKNYNDKNGNPKKTEDWGKIGVKALSTRYLFLDRNSMTHQVSYKIVDELKNPKNKADLKIVLDAASKILEQPYACDYPFKDGDDVCQYIKSQNMVRAGLKAIVDDLRVEKPGIPSGVLQDTLETLFCVNGNNKYGVEFNKTIMPSFTMYHTEIDTYLAYLLLRFQKDGFLKIPKG